jgi:WD40 repeat protein
MVPTVFQADWGVHSVAFSPRGDTVAASTASYIYLWDARSGALKIRIASGPLIFAFAISPDGTRIITQADDAMARVWNTADGYLARNLVGHSDRITSVIFGPDGKTAVTGSMDRSVRRWDLATGRAIMISYGLPGGASLTLNGDGVPIKVQGPEDDAYILVRGMDVRLPSNLRREGYVLPIAEPAAQSDK